MESRAPAGWNIRWEQYAACYLSAAGLCAAEQLAERAGGIAGQQITQGRPESGEVPHASFVSKRIGLQIIPRRSG